MRLGRKLATGVVVTEVTEDIAQEQVAEPNPAPSEQVRLELADEIAKPVNAS